MYGEEDAGTTSQMIREEEVRDRSRDIEAATSPDLTVTDLKTQVNDSLELFSDKLLQLEGELSELKQRNNYDGTLSENDILRVVGVILGNDRLCEYLGQKIRDKFRDKVKVNFEIG